MGADACRGNSASPEPREKSGEREEPPGWKSPGLVGWSQGQLGGNSPCSDIPRLFLAGAPAGTISWPSMWNTGLPGGPRPSLRDSGQPFATGISCLCWRPSLMGRTSDSH